MQKLCQKVKIPSLSVSSGYFEIETYNLDTRTLRVLDILLDYVRLLMRDSSNSGFHSPSINYGMHVHIVASKQTTKRTTVGLTGKMFSFAHKGWLAYVEPIKVHE